jgi:hypothetical protein
LPTRVPDDLGILESVAVVIPRCRHVRIDEARLAEVCAGIEADDLKLPTWDAPVFFPTEDGGRPPWPATVQHSPGAHLRAAQILLFNTVNFCYWGEPKWEVTYGGQRWDGSMAMLAALRRALEEGFPVLDGAYLARLSETELAHIVRGSGQLQLIAERAMILRAAGRILSEEFAGRFENVITAAGGDALALVRLLVERFPSFEDVWPVDGQQVRFYKRAQLATAMLYEAFGGHGWGSLAGTDRLTVFADYKLPQVLRRLEILVYDGELAGAVDSRTLIPPGDRREVEIRATTVWAAELMGRALAERLPDVTALHLDYWLWAAGRYQGPKTKPYHRTVTTAY